MNLRANRLSVDPVQPAPSLLVKVDGTRIMGCSVFMIAYRKAGPGNRVAAQAVSGWCLAHGAGVR